MTSMTARHGTVLSIPPTQNTAPVHEFRCLYTHDVVRKQKRWQDGRVKYHTFNKRLMLYDDTLNFIGDTHWKESHDLSVGDEVSLDAGVLVQVEDLLITTQTDLAPLFERDKNKQQQQYQARDNAYSLALPKLAGRGTGGPENGQHKHRSLSAMLNAGKGARGKASLPMQSPFEVRKANQENEWDSRRDAKRQKIGLQGGSIEQMQPRTKLTGGSKSDKSNPPSARTKSQRNRSNGSNSLQRKIIDITSEADILLSDVTVPSSPKFAGTAARTLPDPKQRKTAPRIPKPKSPAPPSAPPTSPPVSTKSKIRHVDNMQDQVVEVELRKSSPITTPTIAKTRQLRLGKTQQRPMLFCQKKPTQPTRQEAPVMPLKKQRLNLYLSLSDMEDDVEEQMTKVPAKAIRTSILGPRKTTVDLVDNPSNSITAFDTGQSSSPPRIASKKKELTAEAKSRVARQGIEKDDALEIFTDTTHWDESAANVTTDPRTKSLATTNPRKSRKSPLKTTVDVDQEDGGLDPYDVRTAKKKRKLAKAKGQPLSSVINRSNDNVREMDEGMGSRAMEERAKALAAAGPRKDQGPWTTEATDLFDWRPPDWDARANAMGITA